MPRPRLSMVLRTSDGVPLKVMRSFSKISTASNFAAAMASSFSFRLPLNETVAIDVFMVMPPREMSPSLDQPLLSDRRRGGESPLHPVEIGKHAGEQPERFDRLVDAHAGAAHHPAASCSHRLDQIG